MKKYFAGVPRWAIGLAHIIRSGLVVSAMASVVSQNEWWAFGLMVAREMVGTFIAAAEGNLTTDITPKRPTK